MSEDLPSGHSERRPPAPPAGSQESPLTEPASDPSTGSASGPESGPESGFAPTPHDWLDPSSHRHRRKRHSEPVGPGDRLRRKWRHWRRHRRKVARTAHWYRPRNISLGIIGLILISIISVMLSAYLKVNGVRRAPLLPVSASPTSVGTNLLLVASNGQPASLNADVNTLEVEFIHISSNYQSGQVIDLPRDFVIDSGTSATTIAGLYRSGGVVGIVSALQNSMGLTINHAAQTTFTGYSQVTGDLGTLSIQTDNGKQPFTGDQAQSWVAQPSPAGGTIESGSRFQHWSKAMLQATLQPGVLLNPFRAWSVFSHTASNVVVDDTLDNGALIGLVWRLRSLSSTGLHFYTVPNAGYGQASGQQVLLSNSTAFSQLSTAIRTDNVATLGLFQ